MPQNDAAAPSPEVLAAIAAAYRLLTASAAPAALPATSPWRLAGRLGLDDDADARSVAQVRSRWKAAGRLDG